MNLALWSFLGLIALVVISHITSFVFHILNDRFYSFFHLAAGILAAVFFYTLTQNFIISIILTFILGITWEIYEWYQWKLILKKKKFKPDPTDTRNDLVIDFIGSLIGIGFIAIRY
ncbi:hypothetical protein HY407_00665 [Candidatus Gottesmanbacteria bacterium]|nr:hypothetical protein [Candidatus Gottesmanbacteria bacterium]